MIGTNAQDNTLIALLTFEQCWVFLKDLRGNFIEQDLIGEFERI